MIAFYLLCMQSALLSIKDLRLHGSKRKGEKVLVGRKEEGNEGNIGQLLKQVGSG